MGRLNGVTRLPLETQAEINDRLIESGFARYQEFSDELRHRGIDISKSALHRYGAAMEKRLQMERAAKEINAAGVDAEITAELCGDATLVVIVDRTYGRARLVSVPMKPVDVIKALKNLGK